MLKTTHLAATRLTTRPGAVDCGRPLLLLDHHATPAAVAAATSEVSLETFSFKEAET